jgi:hypothetical protein
MIPTILPVPLSKGREKSPMLFPGQFTFAPAQGAWIETQ